MIPKWQGGWKTSYCCANPGICIYAFPGEPTIDTLDSSMKKAAAASKTKGRNLDLLMVCLVNSCQGMDACVYSDISVHQHTGIGYEV